jgi:ribosome-associated protein
VLVDCGDVVVHIFYEPVRALYDIESLWMRAKRLPSQEVA